MIMAKHEDGRIEVRGSGANDDVVDELGILIRGVRESLRGNCESDEEYGTCMAALLGALKRETHETENEMHELANTAENEQTRRGVAAALDFLERLDRGEPGTMEEAQRIIEKYARAAEDGQDPEKVKELEDALQARMAGEDRDIQKDDAWYKDIQADDVW